jgi:hypothetical protein
VTIEADDPRDIIEATVNLAERCGARSWELAYACPHTPDEPPGHTCPDIEWTCTVEYQGAKIFETGRTPPDAAVALAVRLMTGAVCRCRRKVTMNQRTSADQCQWTFQGNRWMPGCDRPPLTVPGGSPGDYEAIAAALTGGNRAQRRASKTGASIRPDLTRKPRRNRRHG